MRRRKVVAGGAVTAVVAATVGFALTMDSGATATDGAGATSTAEVTRQDLVARTSVDGTLGYADARSLTSPTGGTTTALAREGSVVRPGRRLYALDGRPTVLLRGRVPAYRTLQMGAEGMDVRQLERGLRGLGYGGFTVDRQFTSGTAGAVRDWQSDLGVAETGVVEVGAVVFAPGRVRVGAHQAEIGESVAPGGPVTEVSSTRRVVSLDLPVSDATNVRRGGRVTVTLPDGSTARGRITSVGRVAHTSSDEEGGSSDPTIDVEVELTGELQGTVLDSAPVDVALETARVVDALTVPVSALLALAEGGYGVEVAQSGGATRIVAVEVGLFADGRVEVTGSVHAGDRVLVPAS